MVKQVARVPRLKYFETNAVSSALGYVVPVAVGAGCAVRFEQLTRTWRTDVSVLAHHGVNIRELRRMFVAGGIGGFLASRFANPTAALPFHFAHADFVAAWSSVLIAADTAMDQKRLSPEESVDLLSRATRCIFRPVRVTHSSGLTGGLAPVSGRESPSVDVSDEWYPNTDGFAPENLCIAMARVIGGSLDRIAAYHAAHGLAGRHTDDLLKFGGTCAQLADGQLRSLQQTVIDDVHDWGWYSDVLDAKTLGVMLAPLAAFTARDGSGSATLLQRCLLILNDVFFHRGALDDLADVENDTESGVAGVAAYMIISQGRVADVFLRDRTAPDSFEVLSEVMRSRLLRSPSWAWSECREALGTRVDDVRQVDLRSLGHSGATALVTYALANQPADLALTLSELASRRQRIAVSLIDAWRERRTLEALDLIVRSGTAFRVFDTITDARLIRDADSRLNALGASRLKDVFGVFYRRTLNSYGRTLLTWTRLLRRHGYSADVAFDCRDT
jgi:hypothetical protein